MDEQTVRYLHSLLIQRIYHEDSLLAQRTYNFVTTNAFLVAALALFANNNQYEFYAFGIFVFGLILALLQVALGRRNERAILFWREYLRSLETKNNIPLDHTLFDYYEKALVQTPAGLIGKEHERQKPMYKTFPWNLAFMRSTNILVGVVIPWLVAFFWLYMLDTFLIRQQMTIVTWSLSAVFILVFLASWIWVPATPKTKSRKNTASDTAPNSGSNDAHVVHKS